MRFVRVYLAARDYPALTPPISAGDVLGVLEQETPFEHATLTLDGIELDVLDWGAVADFEPRTPSGERCSPAHHIRKRLGQRGAVRPEFAAAMPTRYDCPASLEGIKAKLRAGGPTSIPSPVRAWLVTMLPRDTVNAMGIARGIPISALRAVSAARARRDPNAGSSLFVMERTVQGRIDEQIARRAASRSEAEAARQKALAKKQKENPNG